MQILIGILIGVVIGVVGGYVVLRPWVEGKRNTGRVGKYVDRRVVDDFSRDPQSFGLRAEMREMTVCWCNLVEADSLFDQGDISLGMPTLREYIEAVVPAIRETGGYVNKFIGGRILFFYGAPNREPKHAKQAARAMVAIQRAVDVLNARRKERGVQPLHVTVGVASGPMLVGDVGVRSASDYTVIGPQVRLAAKLEKLAKNAGATNLIAASTNESIGKYVQSRSHGVHDFGGKVGPVEMFEVTAVKEELEKETRM